MENNNDKPATREKREITSKDEQTIPLKRYSPATDIIETENELLVLMDMPGVSKEMVKVKLEKNLLEINGEIDGSEYVGLKPVYSEYNVGHFTRRFELSNEIDFNGIEAKIEDGVLELALPKVPEAEPTLITVN